MRTIRLKNFSIANNLPFVLIAGPCQTESRDHSMMMAENIKKICDKLKINFIYKSSFDKANRSSVSSKRGMGLENTLPIFSEIKKTFDCPILTDIHNEEQCNFLANQDEVDILQIPAFLCRQTDLLACASKSKKIINVKKGQFLAPWDAQNIVDKIDYYGNQNTMLTERGVSFGYNTLVSDMRSLPIMAKTGCPVIFDATHSVQQPGGLGGVSGGQREFVETLASAATAVGVAGLFMETHQDPDNAPSDGPCMLRLDSLEKILTKLKKFDEIAKNFK
ncbi:MAG: 3-deoxy-8-phosphooctulonate synthase [Alphaproteobacteria bacterium]|nr:3-deoxy-8-phosphooctulonate synthase [Alphaproteobacteria bacterium]